MSSNRKRVIIIKEKLKKLEEMLQDVSTSGSDQDIEPRRKRIRLISVSSSDSVHSDVNQGNIVEVDVHREAELSPIPSDKIDSIRINKILGTDPSMPKVMSKPVSDQVASRLNYYATNGTSSDEKEKIRLEWPTPENCLSFNSPTLNPEILALLSPTDQKKDSFMCHIQNDIAGSLSALSSVISKLLDIADLPNVIKEIIPDLMTAGKLQCNAHFQLSMHRRHQVYPLLKSDMQKLAKESKMDNFLFGKTFMEKCKTNQTINKSAVELQVSKVPASSQIFNRSHLNWQRLQNICTFSEKSVCTKQEKGASNTREKQKSMEIIEREPSQIQLPKPTNSVEGTTSALAKAYPGVRNFIREALAPRRLTESALEVVISSLNPNTLKQYNTAYKKWWEFCIRRAVDCFNPSTADFVDFLDNSFKEGASYTTLNTFRSSLNLIINKEVDEKIISRYLKGVFKIKPVFPKYQATWDPNPVIAYLSSLHPLSSLSFADLTYKLVMLFALGTAQRLQTFQKLK
ncbi:unnamed protein product [Acanthoscelides obtectus]|uniref:Uncharacterized protein n=1 Tax=Acanthoscelides obtectus TaxID=200917 RepID=A0A9P0LV78_ACAOB|nr:unnamed protein product [Acanthoscelides obtectus]CAK1670098.1 hypothetical protein AOBTE_LOCUS27399 [Acanthoscelides obtectus]